MKERDIFIIYQYYIYVVDAEGRTVPFDDKPYFALSSEEIAITINGFQEADEKRKYSVGNFTASKK